MDNMSLIRQKSSKTFYYYYWTTIEEYKATILQHIHNCQVLIKQIELSMLMESTVFDLIFIGVKRTARDISRRIESAGAGRGW